MGVSNSKSDSNTPKASPLMTKRFRTKRAKSKSSIEVQDTTTNNKRESKSDSPHPALLSISLSDLTATIKHTHKRELQRANTSTEPIIGRSHKKKLKKHISKKPRSKTINLNAEYTYNTFKEWLGLSGNSLIMLTEKQLKSGEVLQYAIDNKDLNRLYAALQYGMILSRPDKVTDLETRSMIKAFKLMHTLGTIEAISNILPKLKSKHAILDCGIKRKEAPYVRNIIERQFTEMSGVIFLLSLEILQYQKHSSFSFSACDATQWLYVDSTPNKDNYLNHLSKNHRVSYTKISMLKDAVETYTGDKKCFYNFLEIVKDTNKSLTK